MVKELERSGADENSLGWFYGFKLHHSKVSFLTDRKIIGSVAMPLS